MVFKEWLVDWHLFIRSIGSVDAATLSVKLPSHKDPFPIPSCDALHAALRAYMLAMEHDPAVACLARPPVIVIFRQGGPGWPQPHGRDAFGHPFPVDKGTAEPPPLAVRDRFHTQNEAGDLVSWAVANARFDVPLADSEALWLDVCEFFLHDPRERATGVRLPGTKVTLHPYQMVDVWKMLSVITSGVASGTYNTSTPELGRTIECMAAAAVANLAVLSRQHRERHPELHARPAQQLGCLDHRRFGIKCYCQGGKFTVALARGLHPLPMLAAVPRSRVAHWQDQHSAFFHEHVDSHAGERLSKSPLVIAVLYRGGKSLECTTKTIKDVRPHHLHPSVSMVEDHPGVPKPGKAASSSSSGESPAEGEPWPLIMFASYHNGDHTTVDAPTPHPRLRQDAFPPDARRFMLLASAPDLRSDAFDDLFRSKVEVTWSNRKKPTDIDVKACFLASVMFRDDDEYAPAEDEGDQALLGRLLHMADSLSLIPLPRRRRPLVCLLGQTPMTNGLRDLRRSLPLLCRRNDSLEEQRASFVAYQNTLAEDPPRPFAVQNAREHLSSLAKSVLGPVMIHRWFGQPFLGGSVPDARPPCRYHPAVSPPAEPRHQRALGMTMPAVRRVHDSIAGTPTSDREKQAALIRSPDFTHAHVCSVLPGAVELPGGPVDPSFCDAGVLPDTIRLIRCGQLDALEMHCRLLAVEPTARHSLVLTIQPTVARLAAAYLRRILGDSFTVALVAAADAASLLPTLRGRSQRQPSKPIIIVSAYEDMSNAKHDLHRFVSRVVLLGSPFNRDQEIHGVAHVHRGGQKEVVDVLPIDGAPNSIDSAISMASRGQGTFMGLMAALEMHRDDGR
ncbi:hypothetical protein S40293_08793 [Stachybotrys chartarum IBT 40293]|nr:hypothetical protein S40293_08793 [Stachybotrys chartarum IBT 40293]